MHERGIELFAPQPDRVRSNQNATSMHAGSRSSPARPPFSGALKLPSFPVESLTEVLWFFFQGKPRGVGQGQVFDRTTMSDPNAHQLPPHQHNQVIHDSGCNGATGRHCDELLAKRPPRYYVWHLRLPAAWDGCDEVQDLSQRERVLGMGKHHRGREAAGCLREGVPGPFGAGYRGDYRVFGEVIPILGMSNQ